MEEILIIIPVIFFAAIVQSVAGFGFALVAMPLLTLFIPLSEATPLVTLTGVLITAVIFLRHKKKFKLSQIVQLFIGSIIGIPVGVIALQYVDEYILKIILALILVSYSIFALRGKIPQFILPRYTGYIFGFFSGLFGSSLNTNGPPVIVYTSLQNWDKDEIIVTLQGFFMTSGAVIILSHAINGFITWDIFMYFLLLIPVLGAGFLIGSFIYKRLPLEIFRKIIYVMLILLSIIMVVK